MTAACKSAAVDRNAQEWFRRARRNGRGTSRPESARLRRGKVSRPSVMVPHAKKRRTEIKKNRIRRGFETRLSLESVAGHHLERAGVLAIESPFRQHSIRQRRWEDSSLCGTFVAKSRNRIVFVSGPYLASLQVRQPNSCSVFADFFQQQARGIHGIRFLAL